MNHRMKSGALTLSLFALASCSNTAGLESSFEESLTLDVAMIAADATIDEFSDMGQLFGGGGRTAGPARSRSTKTTWCRTLWIHLRRTRFTSWLNPATSSLATLGRGRARAHVTTGSPGSRAKRKPEP